MNILNQIVGFLTEVKLELSNVSWLNRKDVINTTFNVLLLAVGVSLFLFGLDLLFEKFLLILLNR